MSEEGVRRLAAARVKKSVSKDSGVIGVPVGAVKVDPGVPTSAERAAKLRQKEISQIETEFSRAFIRGDIRRVEGGRGEIFEAVTSKGQSILSLASAADRRTLALQAQQQLTAQQKLKSQVQQKRLTLDSRVQRVQDLVQTRQLQPKPLPPLSLRAADTEAIGKTAFGRGVKDFKAQFGKGFGFESTDRDIRSLEGVELAGRVGGLAVGIATLGGSPAEAVGKTAAKIVARSPSLTSLAAKASVFSKLPIAKQGGRLLKGLFVAGVGSELLRAESLEDAVRTGFSTTRIVGSIAAGSAAFRAKKAQLLLDSGFVPKEFRFLKVAPEIAKRVALSPLSLATGTVGGRPASVRAGRTSKPQLRQRKVSPGARRPDLFGVQQGQDVSLVNVGKRINTNFVTKGKPVSQLGAVKGERGLVGLEKRVQQVGQSVIVGRAEVAISKPSAKSRFITGQTVERGGVKRVEALIKSSGGFFTGQTVPQIKGGTAEIFKTPKLTSRPPSTGGIKGSGLISLQKPAKPVFNPLTSQRVKVSRTASVQELERLTLKRVSLDVDKFGKSAFSDLGKKPSPAFVEPPVDVVRGGFRAGQKERLFASLQLQKQSLALKRAAAIVPQRIDASGLVQRGVLDRRLVLPPLFDLRVDTLKAVQTPVLEKTLVFPPLTAVKTLTDVQTDVLRDVAVLKDVQKAVLKDELVLGAVAVAKQKAVLPPPVTVLVSPPALVVSSLTTVPPKSPVLRPPIVPPIVPPITSTPIRPLPIKPVRLPPIIGLPGLGDDIVGGNDFSVLVRRKGEFVSAGLGLSKQAAISLGSGITRGASAVSFKVLKAGRPINIALSNPLLRGEFTRAKRERGVLVERSKFRIDAPGEFEEITFKGLLALKFRSGLL